MTEETPEFSAPDAAEEYINWFIGSQAQEAEQDVMRIMRGEIIVDVDCATKLVDYANSWRRMLIEDNKSFENCKYYVVELSEGGFEITDGKQI